MANKVDSNLILHVIYSLIFNSEAIPAKLFERLVKISEDIKNILEANPELHSVVMELVEYRKDLVHTKHLKELYKDKDFTVIVKDIFKGENK
ncbi:hypothetical protein [Sphingobacterium sp.]|uniref:hypothetical protein n=1 Tax=Sphingobacterium sp. TaxID=341027 RepID=UPI0028ADF89E|nr:hypothetical protein [Sphingobacterium sp.]